MKLINIFKAEWIYLIVFSLQTIYSCRTSTVSINNSSNETREQLVLPTIHVINNLITVQGSYNSNLYDKINFNTKKYETFANTKLDLEIEKDTYGEVDAEFILLKKNGLITEIKIIKGLDENTNKSVKIFIQRLSYSKIFIMDKYNLNVHLKMFFDIKRVKNNDLIQSNHIKLKASD